MTTQTAKRSILGFAAAAVTLIVVLTVLTHGW